MAATILNSSNHNTDVAFYKSEIIYGNSFYLFTISYPNKNQLLLGVLLKKVIRHKQKKKLQGIL